MRRIEAVAFGDIHIGRYRFLRLLAAVARKAAEQRVTRPCRLRAVEILPGQCAESQAGVGQQLHAFELTHFREADFKAAVQQAVRILNRHDPRQVVLIRQVQITHHAEGGFVRHADVADLPGALELGQRFEGIQQGHGGRGISPGITQLAKAVGWALRPVYLVQVEVIGLQPLQAGVQRLADIFAVQDVIGPNAAVVIARGPANFGGQHQLFAIAAFRQPVADVGFSQPLSFRARRDGVHFGDIDQIDAVGDRIVELLMGISFAVLLAKGHGPQPEGADFK